jgi:hypothetical protein
MEKSLNLHSTRRQTRCSKMSEKRIARYVFSLSKKDKAFEDGKIETAVKWLRNKDEKPYLFRNGKPRRLPSGSIVLFKFQAQIFGQAEVKKPPEELPLEEKRKAGDYKYSMILNGSSIEIFPEPYPTQKDVESEIGKKCGQLFTILTAVQYQQILKMAGE